MPTGNDSFFARVFQFSIVSSKGIVCDLTRPILWKLKFFTRRFDVVRIELDLVELPLKVTTPSVENERIERTLLL